MYKIRKKIKSKNDFDNLLKILIDRVKNNKPISDNNMLDGMIIGFISAHKKIKINEIKS